ncbi:MAG TPA: hypothetical protein VK364_12385, partial [Hymenobacter sp.]|nr:hypothetical protein [Hymenobacter sp.]
HLASFLAGMMTEATNYVEGAAPNNFACSGGVVKREEGAADLAGRAKESGLHEGSTQAIPPWLGTGRSLQTRQ